MHNRFLIFTLLPVDLLPVTCIMGTIDKRDGRNEMINPYNEGYKAAKMYIELRNKCCERPTNPYSYDSDFLDHKEWESGYLSFEEMWYDI